MPLRSLVYACYTSLLLFLAPSLHAIELPELGDSAYSLLSSEKEQQLGQAFMRAIRRSLPLEEDPLVNDYLADLGQRLVAYSDSEGRRYQFFTVNNGGINAFAGPGGYIGVNSGLILTSRSESELAAVLAHEIAHVTQNHLVRRLEFYNKLNIPSLAAIIAAVVIATQDGDAGRAALSAANALPDQAARNFSRGHEQEADRIGIDTLARAGFDVNSMAAFFGRLLDSQRYNNVRLPEFLSTHPVSENRIADARARARQYSSAPVEDSLDYRLIRARLQVLQQPIYQESINTFATLIKQQGERASSAYYYGYAIALQRNHQYAEANRYLNKLLNRHPDHPYLRLLEIELAMQQKRLPQALAMIKVATSLYEDYLPLTLIHAQALILNQDSRAAVELLIPLLDAHPEYSELYRKLYQAQGLSRDQLGGLRTRAEYLFIRGDLKNAIAQLKLARKLTRDGSYQASAIDARIDELEELRDQELNS